jgi:hypothetical protein
MQKFVRFSSWLTGAGMGLVLHGDLSDDRGCRPTGIFFRQPREEPLLPVLRLM